MKKFFMVLIFMASYFMLTSCETLVDEGPDSITIKVEGLKGTGSLEEPYLLNINVGETIEKHVLITGEYESLEYLMGNKKNDRFVVDETISNIAINENTTDSYLSVKGSEVGKSMFRIKGKDLSSSAYFNVVTGDHDYKKTLKVLAIGNSFSEDATTYLGEIAADFGIEEMIIGNMYIGGATLETHWNSAKNSTSSYRYDKNVDNKWTTKGNKSLILGLLDEDWDIVTLQQASGLSGMGETYQPFMDDLLGYINEKKLTDTTFLFHQTWAYAANSNHSQFQNYEKDQSVMYQAIMGVSTELILRHETFKQIIPSGTAIQNVRNSLVGDNVTRDGYHLNSYGRYVAGLMWFRMITGFSIDDITYKPASVTEEQMTIAKEAVNHAYLAMFEVTMSSHQK